MRPVITITLVIIFYHHYSYHHYQIKLITFITTINTTRFQTTVQYLYVVITLGCFDEGVEDEEDGLLGGLAASFFGFLSPTGDESGPFSTAGEGGSWVEGNSINMETR